jgi:hypothetical protein
MVGIGGEGVHVGLLRLRVLALPFEGYRQLEQRVRQVGLRGEDGAKAPRREIPFAPFRMQQPRGEVRGEKIGPRVRAAIEAGERLLGAPLHLAHHPDLVGGRMVAWVEPFGALERSARLFEVSGHAQRDADCEVGARVARLLGGDAARDRKRARRVSALEPPECLSDRRARHGSGPGSVGGRSTRTLAERR